MIADSVTSIGEDVFYCCGSLISVTLPSVIDTIKPGTFYDCAALQSIVIPEGVKIIAKKMKENGLDINLISSITGLKIEELKSFEIKKEFS